jgi:YggT family protein
MFVLGNLIGAVATVLDVLLNALGIILIVNALLSWVRPDPSNPIVRFLDQVSDAVCDPIRRLLPTVVGGLDLAPMIAILAIWFLRMFVVQSLHELAFRVG